MFKTLLSSIFLISILSCSKNENQLMEAGFQNYSVNKNISKNQIFTLLDKEKDFHYIRETRIRDINSMRTSNIELTIYNKKNQTKTNYNELICNVDFLPSMNSNDNDTLGIFIGNFNGYSGNSILVKLFKKHYLMTYSEISDIVTPEDLLPEYNLKKSELILDKNNYEIGDSIYGYLNLKTESDSIIINAKGYFRSIVDNNLMTL